MKKSIFKTAIILSALVLILGSCSKKSDENTRPPAQLAGKFKLVLNDVVVADESTNEVGMYEDIVTVGRDENLGIIIAKVPTTVGGVTNIGDDANSGSVSISGMNILNSDGVTEVYISISGTITRDSETKVSFQGTCGQLGSPTVINLSGYAESDAFKTIQ